MNIGDEFRDNRNLFLEENCPNYVDKSLRKENLCLLKAEQKYHGINI